MPEESATVSQVGQIGDLMQDFVPAAKPVEDKPIDDKPIDDKPIVDKPVEDKPVDDKPIVKDEKDEAIKSLMEQVKTLSTKVTELSTKKAEPAKPAESVAPVVGMGYFKDKAEYEAAFEKPEVMSEVMGRVRNKAVEDVLKAIPQVINNVVKVQMEVHQRTADFFIKNQDLKDHKEFIGFVANDLSGRNPDWTMEELFEKLPGEVRKRIGMKAEVKKPAFILGKKGGARVPGEKPLDLTPIEQEISDLM